MNPPVASLMNLQKMTDALSADYSTPRHSPGELTPIVVTTLFPHSFQLSVEILLGNLLMACCSLYPLVVRACTP